MKKGRLAVEREKTEARGAHLQEKFPSAGFTDMSDADTLADTGHPGDIENLRDTEDLRRN